MKLREIASVGQHRLDYGFKENPFCERRPTSTANDFGQLRVVLVARKVGQSLVSLRGVFRSNR